MKKLAVLFITTILFAPYGFAESTVSGASTPIYATKGFDITANASGVASVSVPPPKPAVSIDKSMEIIAATKHDENESLPYTIDVIYPQISGENLSAPANEFNRLISEMINKSMQQFKNYVKADMPHMQTLPDSVKHNTLNMDYQVDILKPGKKIILSVRLSTEGMQAGRAHPYHSHQTLNFDLSNGKVLTLNDLFKPRAKYLNAFSKYSNHALNQKMQDKSMIKNGTAALPKNYPLWNLKNNGILITFEEYQVGPYADGVQEVEIPYSTLKRLIAHNAPIAVCVKSPTGCGVES